MSRRNILRKRFLSLVLVFGLLSVAGLVLGFTPDRALGAAPGAGQYSVNPISMASIQSQSDTLPDAACSGGPVIDGVTLNECVDNTFTVGGTSKTVRVWYSKVVQTVQRNDNGTVYNLTHYITADSQAQDVAQWAREAWERYYQVFGHHPYNDGCNNRINIQLEEGVGWSGIAYWASSGSCRIGIDAPMVRNGGGQGVVYHEMQHYLQYSFNSGCYAFLKANYDSGSAAGDAEFVEGYADLAMDTVDSALDLTLYNNIVHDYNPLQNFYDKGYWDVFNKYFSEQLGSQYASTDPQWHFDAVRSHYEMCDAQDTLYVLDDLVPDLKPGLGEKELFLNFFAANWAKDWANATTQPELVYFDEKTGPTYGSIALYKDENITSGTKSYSSQATPALWAARYYQVKPQSGCSFVTASVDGAAGSNLGISLMAAHTASPASVTRTAWIGEDVSRTFPGYGTYDRIVAVVNAFDHSGSYDVSFTCSTPVVDLQEPRQTNFALVGDPSSPIAFLARFKVTSDGSPIRGLTESLFSAQAGSDAITLVPGSLSQVGEDYWAIMVPPTKPAGTSFVNLKVCVSTTFCDTEANALLYVNPGNTDFALVFDGSGSMSIEDVAGEGTRLENAKKAGTVLADLLRIGDRILVTDFSTIWNGSQEVVDIITRLSRTLVENPASATIGVTKNAINTIVPRNLTPIGAALQNAKNQLTAAPLGTNPKHIILLSDGMENVAPYYAAVKDELVASGVVVDTIRFSNDAPGALLAQIAADTGGSYSYVPTAPGTLLTSQQLLQPMIDQLTLAGIPSDQTDALISARDQSFQQVMDQLTQMGVPAEISSRITATSLPGPLGLDNVYDYYETNSQSAARLFHNNYLGSADQSWEYSNQFVDESVNTLRIVVAGKQGDDITCGGFTREVGIQPPSERPYYPVSPPDGTTPADWDIRHSLYDDVVIIPNPIPGEWHIRTRYVFHGPCLADNLPVAPDAPTAFTSDFMVNMSAETNIQLVGRFLPPIMNNQGAVGDYVPIVATLLSRTGAIPGAIVLAAIERPGGTSDLLLLWDDGLHNDGAAGDGVYGNEYRTAIFGGNYNVRMVALGYDAVYGKWNTREWNGGFFLDGPILNPGSDGDYMPDAWELRCGLDPSINDGGDDKDHDGLLNIWEFVYGTLPCQADTDLGGENDGSEINGRRNPLYAPDDMVRPLGHISVIGFNERIRVEWTHAISYTNMIGWLSPVEGVLGDPVDMGDTGIFTFTGRTNDLPVFLVLQGVNGIDLGDFSDPIPVIPRADPDAPRGAVLINNGALMTASKNVTLHLSASDVPLLGLADPYAGGTSSPLALEYNIISGNIQMRISNDPTFADAAWEPFNQQKPWTLLSGGPHSYIVYAQFRDAAGNLSAVVYDTILYAPIFLPIIVR